MGITTVDFLQPSYYNINMEKIYEAVPRFNDHGSNCSGHTNYVLDCDYTKQQDRELLSKVLDNYILQKDKNKLADILGDTAVKI